jgi:hypothetical protein
MLEFPKANNLQVSEPAADKDANLSVRPPLWIANAEQRLDPFEILSRLEKASVCCVLVDLHGASGEAELLKLRVPEEHGLFCL